MNLGTLWYCVNHMYRGTEPILISALPLNHPPKFGIDASKVWM